MGRLCFQSETFSVDDLDKIPEEEHKSVKLDSERDMSFNGYRIDNKCFLVE